MPALWSLHTAQNLFNKKVFKNSEFRDTTAKAMLKLFLLFPPILAFPLSESPALVYSNI
jgi:hypothetical protein